MPISLSNALGGSLFPGSFQEGKPKNKKIKKQKKQKNKNELNLNPVGSPIFSALLFS
jgi:hypothetical protein